MQEYLRPTSGGIPASDCLSFCACEGGTLSLEKDEIVGAWTSREALSAGSSRPGTDDVVAAFGRRRRTLRRSRKSQNPPPAPSKPSAPSQAPEEKKAPEAAPGQLQLETPEAPAKPEAQARQQHAETGNPTAPATPPAEEHKPTIESIVSAASGAFRPALCGRAFFRMPGTSTTKMPWNGTSWHCGIPVSSMMSAWKWPMPRMATRSSLSMCGKRNWSAASITKG